MSIWYPMNTKTWALSGAYYWENQKKKVRIDWITIINENKYDHLIMLKDNLRFYMTSYIVYLPMERVEYPGITKIGSFPDQNVWPHIVYP